MHQAWRRLRRWWRTVHGGKRLSVVYDSRYERAVTGMPLDPLRGEKIVAFLAGEGLLDREDVHQPRPVSLRNLLRVHTPEYLQQLQEPETLTRILGVEVPAAEAERVLDLERLMVGGTIQATRLALRGGGIAVNLGGGFHHATRDAGMAFCVFNDVAVAIERLRARGYTERILVVDLDLHDGNGTRRLFADDPSVHTYSVHGEHWSETEAVESTAIALGHGVGDAVYLEAVGSTLPTVFQRFRPALVFYLAGGDPAAGDRLGDWSVTPAGLLARDRLVAGLARRGEQTLPLVVLLAGGYGHLAWRHPARFLAYLAGGRVLEPPDEEQVILDRMRRVGRSLSPAELGAEPDDLPFSLSAEDLPGMSAGWAQPTRFLGALSRHGVELLLERAGILDQLRARGFYGMRVALELDEPTGQSLRVLAAGPPEVLLLELRVNRTRRAVPGCEVISVEWLLLQNPRSTFTPHRPRLPGQQYPGLGLLKEVFGVLVVLAETLGLDGLQFQVAHFHVAVLGRSFLRCLRPEDEARSRAFAAALSELPLGEASRALAEGRLVWSDSGVVAAWQPSPMVLPASERLKALVLSPEYEAQVAEAQRTLRLVLIESTLAR